MFARHQASVWLCIAARGTALCYPRPVKHPSIAIIGLGRLGSALAKHLHSAGYCVSEIICRDRQSLSRARKLARSIRADATTLQNTNLDSDIIWLCVPDSQIEPVANALAASSWKGKLALHSSGVLTSDALASLRKSGASVASAHPLMTFVRGSAADLSGVPFAIEGDGAAVRAARSIVLHLGGRPVAIRKADKPAYHLFATMICPLLISLLASSERSAKLAGMSPAAARRRMLPIIRQTISNYEELGAATAFTGPLVRGDVETVRLHLKELSRSPALKAVYVSLAEAALQNLPQRNAKQIRTMLRGRSRD